MGVVDMRAGQEQRATWGIWGGGAVGGAFLLLMRSALTLDQTHSRQRHYGKLKHGVFCSVGNRLSSVSSLGINSGPFYTKGCLRRIEASSGFSGR